MASYSQLKCYPDATGQRKFFLEIRAFHPHLPNV